jgi:hypothetical protein
VNRSEYNMRFQCIINALAETALYPVDLPSVTQITERALGRAEAVWCEHVTM